MVIWLDAINAQNNMAAVSAQGSTVCVLILRLNSSCKRPDRVRRADRFPLALRKAREGEQLVAGAANAFSRPTRTCARTEGNPAIQTLGAAAKEGRDVFRASQTQPQLPPAALTQVERRERRVPARRRRAEFAKAHPLPQPGPADRAVARRVRVRSVEECLPGHKPGGKSRIALATQTPPFIPIGETSNKRTAFQRHP